MYGDTLLLAGRVRLLRKNCNCASVLLGGRKMIRTPRPAGVIQRVKSRSRMQKGPGLRSRIKLHSSYMSPEDRVRRKSLIDDFVKKHDVRCSQHTIVPLPEGDHGYGIWGKFSK